MSIDPYLMLEDVKISLRGDEFCRGRIRGCDYYAYEQMLKTARIDLETKTYKIYVNIVGWFFVENVWDESSLNYTLQVLHLINYKKQILKKAEEIAIANAKRRGFDFVATKKDFYGSWQKYLHHR